MDQGKIVGAIILGDTNGIAAIKRLIDIGKDVTKYKDSDLEIGFDFIKILS